MEPRKRCTEKKRNPKKKRNPNWDLAFLCPGELQAHGEKEGPRQRRQVEQLFVRPTSRKTYSCARVENRYVGRTEIEITATFVVEEADEEPLIGEENKYVLDKEKCPICRSDMDVDCSECFIGDCCICKDKKVPCMLSCTNKLRIVTHALCEKTCHKRYEN
jgi:hypothetical protein